MHYIAGFSGMLQPDGGDTIDIANRIPGARHFASFSGLSDWEEVANDIIAHRKWLKSVCLFGLSNGARSILYIQERLAEHGIPVDYLGIIDLALLHKPKIMPNVRHVQEFHSALDVSERHEDFHGKYEYFRLDEILGRNVGHSEAARVPFTQDKIVEAITAITSRTSEPVQELDMKITPRMALEIAFHEGLVQETYKDSEGVDTWSIGVTSASGHHVERYKANPATIERCIEVYIWLLDTKYAPAVRKMFAGHNLTEAQFTAALSFHWNTGAIESASWVNQWKRGDIDKARASIMLWRIPSSIIGRRRAERDLFFDGDWSGDGTVAHYRAVTTSGQPTDSVRLDISEPIQRAIDAHYGISVPDITIPDKTPVPPGMGDVESLRAHLLELFPNLEPSQADFLLAQAYLSRRRSTPETEPDNPATERGFLLPESQSKGNGMGKIMEAFDGKKTFLLAALVIAIGLSEGVLMWDVPGIDVGDDWVNYILTGLGIGTFRDALRKIQ